MATDDALLCLGRESVPCLYVVEVLLHDDVAAAAKSSVFVAYDGGFGGFLSAGILCAIDEAHDVAVVEVAEAVDLVCDCNVVAEAFHDVGG